MDSVYILSNRKDFQYLIDGINQHTASNIYTNHHTAPTRKHYQQKAALHKIVNAPFALVRNVVITVYSVRYTNLGIRAKTTDRNITDQYVTELAACCTTQ